MILGAWILRRGVMGYDEDAEKDAMKEKEEDR